MSTAYDLPRFAGLGASANPIDAFVRQAQATVQRAMQDPNVKKAVGAAEKAYAKGGVEALLGEGQKLVELGQRAVKDPIGALVNKLTVLTAYTSPLVYTGKELVAAMNAPPNPKSTFKVLGSRIKPTFILEPAVGPRQVYAPFGEAGPKEWVENQTRIKLQLGAVVVGLLGAGYLLGRYHAGKRRK